MRSTSRLLATVLLLALSTAPATCGVGDRADPLSTHGPAKAVTIIDLTSDSLRTTSSLGTTAPPWPELGGSCYVYDKYVVVAWGAPGQHPVAIVRKRGSGADTAAIECSADSLAGDFVLRNEWAEYFSDMWDDLLVIDSGTGDIRSQILYDVPTRRKVLEIDGAGETDGWIDERTVRIWVLAGTDLARSVCPEIPEMFGVGVDSLYALDLTTFALTPLGAWRCHALQ